MLSVRSVIQKVNLHVLKCSVFRENMKLKSDREPDLRRLELNFVTVFNAPYAIFERNKVLLEFSTNINNSCNLFHL